MTHPLDIKLMDLVDGNLPADEVGPIEEHLASCSLCRLKRSRLERHYDDDDAEDEG